MQLVATFIVHTHVIYLNGTCLYSSCGSCSSRQHHATHAASRHHTARLLQPLSIAKYPGSITTVGICHHANHIANHCTSTIAAPPTRKVPGHHTPASGASQPPAKASPQQLLSQPAIFLCITHGNVASHITLSPRSLLACWTQLSDEQRASVLQKSTKKSPPFQAQNNF